VRCTDCADWKFLCGCNAAKTQGLFCTTTVRLPPASTRSSFVAICLFWLLVTFRSGLLVPSGGSKRRFWATLVTPVTVLGIGAIRQSETQAAIGIQSRNETTKY